MDLRDVYYGKTVETNKCVKVWDSETGKYIAVKDKFLNERIKNNHLWTVICKTIISVWIMTFFALAVGCVGIVENNYFSLYEKVLMWMWIVYVVSVLISIPFFCKTFKTEEQLENEFRESSYYKKEVQKYRKQQKLAYEKKKQEEAQLMVDFYDTLEDKKISKEDKVKCVAMYFEKLKESWRK